MFTGLVAALGVVKEVSRQARDLRLEINAPLAADAVLPGDSVAVNGVCLTAEKTRFIGTTLAFSAYASEETLSNTTLGRLTPGSRVNLEPALCLGQRLGGHIVSGHVDGLAEVSRLENRSASHLVRFACDPALDMYIVNKGSVCVDGISLTVNACGPGYFELNLIPATWSATTARFWRPGHAANLEVDLLGKYVAKVLRLHQADPAAGPGSGRAQGSAESRGTGLGPDFFIKHSFMV